MTCCFAHSLPLKSVCKDTAAGSHHLQWVRIDLHKGQSHKASLLFWALRAVVQNRLVKVPPLERPTGHIVHQTFWHKTSRCASRGSRCVTSESKEASRQQGSMAKLFVLLGFQFFNSLYGKIREL